MRILLDEARSRLGRGVGPHACGRSPTPTTRCCPRRWSVGRSSGFELLIPRQLEIIYEINRRFLDDVRARYPGDDGRVARDEPDRGGAGRKQVRMANLAIVGSHSTNGVAAIHSRAPAHDDGRRISPRCFPSASTTRPTASRRGAGCCWPIPGSADADHARRSATAGSPISRSCSRLKPLADDAGFRASVPQGASAQAKARFADWLKRHTGRRRRPGHDLRLPDQAHSRIQAAAAERAARSSSSTTACARTRASTCRRARSSSPARRRRPITWPS